MRQILPTLFLLAVISPFASAQLGTGADVNIALPADGQDMAYDAARQLLYVSMPSLNSIAVVAIPAYQVVNTVFVGAQPHGIDISSDGSTLYVALRGASQVAFLDLDTYAVSTVIVGSETGNALTFDVVEARPDWIFVSANPGSGGFAWIALIRRDLGNTVTRVASNRIIRANPTFQKTPGQTSLFIGEGFSPNSLYRLDITQPTAPLVDEDNHGSVSGTQSTDVSPNGQRIVLRSGQILDTASFLQLGTIGGGIPRYSSTGNEIFVAPDETSIEVWDVATMLMTSSFSFTCPSSGGFFALKTMLTLPGDEAVLSLSNNRICGITDATAQSCALPGSGEDLLMLTQGNGIGCKPAFAGQILTVEVLSPQGMFVGRPPVLLGQFVMAGTPLSSPSGFPEVQIDPSQGGVVVLFDGTTTAGPTGSTVLPPSGLALAYVVPAGLGGTMARFQGFALDGTAANAIFASTNGHDIMF